MYPVSIISTVRDEPVARVRRMLDAVAAQAGTDPLEVVIAAPASEHRSLEAIVPAGAIASISLVDNPSGRRSSGLNAAVRAASHPICCRVDARSSIPPSYVAEATEVLMGDPGVGVVGGVQMPAAARPGRVPAGIARALANPLAMGAAAYRRAGHPGPAETAYLGTFRTQELLALGGFEERLDANEDFELCARYRRAGYVVEVLDLPVAYEARDDLPAVFRQYEAFGRSKVRYWRLTGDRPNHRQLLAISLGLAGAVAGGLLLVSRPRGLPPVALGGIGALAVVDHIGAGDASATERAVSCATYAIVYAGWLTGLASEWLKGG